LEAGVVLSSEAYGAFGAVVITSCVAWHASGVDEIPSHAALDDLGYAEFSPYAAQEHITPVNL